MISVCIPIHNYYTYPLVRRLVTQRENLSNPEEVEIVCIDVNSSGYYLSQNNGICDLAKYLSLKNDIGRAAIRNLFLKYTHGDWLLYLDADSLVPEHFLKKYLQQVNGKYDVVVGGRTYDQRGDDDEHRLRYLYGTLHECLPLKQRNANPYRSFLACNFMIRRSVMQNILFDTRIVTYGNEGLLFAYKLEERRIPILHIDNTVINGYVETNVEYLHKAVEEVEGLVQIYDFMWEDQRFCHTVPLLNDYAKLRRMGLKGLAYRQFCIFRSLMESHFVSGKGISMKRFHHYKLGIFLDRMRSGKKEKEFDYNI